MNDTLDFSKSIPPEKLALIFKDYFEQHMAAYYMLKGMELISFNNVDIDRSSIIYSIRVLDPSQKERLLDILQRRSATVNIYGKIITPEVFMNGDLLCITIKK